MLNAADANPVTAQYSINDGVEQTFEFPIAFTIVPGVERVLNYAVQNDDRFVLWDISVVTPDPGDTAYKILPGNPDSEGVS